MLLNLTCFFADDEARRLTQNCRTKRDNVERLNKELTSVEQQTSKSQQQIDTSIQELNVCTFFT
jgi:hypothetical protein